MKIYAAGALCWREGKDGLEVALIHRGRYHDWTFPKGKVDKGETLAEAAVREIFEETGLRVKLGVPLTEVSYPLEKSKTKVVHYWAARVSDRALAKTKFKANEEVSEVLWLAPTEAFAKLSYQHDRDLLHELLELRGADMLRTRPLIILRHATATPRIEFGGEESKRPLLPKGRVEAEELVSLISAFGPKRIYSSPWKRCRETIAPYAKAKKLKVIERGELTEAGNAKGPSRTAKLARKLFSDARSSLLCTHRPTLPTIAIVLANLAEENLKGLILGAKKLSPGDFVVLHLAGGSSNPRIVAVEEHSLSERF